MKKSFTHFTKSGDAQMVDIYGKDITERMAVASGKIYMSNASIEMVRDGTHKKGDVLGIARIAGITASKKTPGLAIQTRPSTTSDAGPSCPQKPSVD